jgi:hypothetical protein
VAVDMLRSPRSRELGPALHAANYGAARAQSNPSTIDVICP